MRQATVRDLRYHFPEIETLLQDGEEIQITKRKRIIARLVPEKPVPTAARPAYLGRLRKIYGNKKRKIAGTELLAEQRDRNL